MMELHEDVRTWLHTQKDWLQQAAEMLLSKGVLDDNDITALAEHLKTAEGQMITSDRAFSGLAVGAMQTAEIRLKSIGDITGIENLGPCAPLEFGTGNLCVIYGNNGSGKSGYTRLVKKATGKAGAKDLKSNVFAASPAEKKCRIGFHDGADQVTEWHANTAPIEALRAVDIFDSDCASTYLSKDNEATYTPPLVSLFEKLALTVTRIKEKLQTQQAALVSAKPALPPQHLQTQAGAQYAGLRYNTSDAEIQKISIWTDGGQQSLVQLNERLAAADPAGLAKRKRAAKTQLDQIASQMKKAAAFTVAMPWM